MGAKVIKCGGNASTFKSDNFAVDETKVADVGSDSQNNENEFSESQQEVIELIRNKKNVFLTGIAGSGKSYLITKLRSIFPDKSIVITSTTGISAFNIGGLTIHSYLGLGIGDRTVKASLSKLTQSIKQGIRNLDILVIDEISMLSSELFEKINEILQKIRGRSKAPFGGVQIILSGDLLQLETIGNFTSIIESQLFQEFAVFKLTTNFRQKEDPLWSSILNRLRVNQLTEDDVSLLQDKVEEFDEYNDFVIIKTTNNAVNAINDRKYAQLSGDEYTYKTSEKGSKTLLFDLRKQFSAKGITELKLKAGCKVMLIRNLNTELGLINGATGIVTGFTAHGVPIVKFDHLNYKVTVDREEWTREIDSERCTINQIPLILSWANTVHKCQGLSLSEAVIDISASFCNHQVYVALSRVKTLSGLHLKKSFNVSKITVNKRMIDFYEQH